ETTTTTTPEIVIYTVKSGDTLSKIAENYYSNSKLYSLIKEANGLTSDNITIGQQLIIPPKPEPTTAAAALSASEQDGGAAAVNGTVSRQSTQ
ncbi:MAG: LysM peptidoglycan-binding domain-containing protein, partial [Clostridiales bacterium]|nr:LysM peptidoglycan-binding domain-containing protein [Clostridiales bacterium]